MTNSEIINDHSIIPTFNLKLAEKKRKTFKAIAHNNGTSMQAVLSAFVDSYIENPDKFQIRMLVQEKI